jgi:hypothetical protein
MGLRECISATKEPDDPADNYQMRVQKAIIRAGGLALTSHEFWLAWRWEREDGIPINIIFAAIREKARRMKPGQRLRLMWIQDDLGEQYETWRRAVGPT